MRIGECTSFLGALSIAMLQTLHPVIVASYQCFFSSAYPLPHSSPILTEVISAVILCNQCSDFNPSHSDASGLLRFSPSDNDYPEPSVWDAERSSENFFSLSLLVMRPPLPFFYISSDHSSFIYLYDFVQGRYRLNLLLSSSSF